MIIPFFIPHSGCPHQCVFCNQKKITGESRQADAAAIPQTVRKYLDSHTGQEPVEIAFYGGSFTALPFESQRTYLNAASPFLASGKIQGIRLSTRPDAISRGTVSLLQEYRVSTVELGAQSMDDSVLIRSGRGHTTADTRNAARLLREHHFTIGLQLMPGLPGDSPETFMKTVDRVIELQPDFVRIYPALVIKNTPLHGLFTAGLYSPLSLEEAVSLCGSALRRFNQAGINVIRIGLQPSEELERPGTIVAGPYHPAFRQLVEASLFLDAMRAEFVEQRRDKGTAVFRVNPADLSVATGQKRSNITVLSLEFGIDVRILPDESIPRGTIHLHVEPATHGDCPS